MRQCKFPLAPTLLTKKNENLDIKVENNAYSFTLNGVVYKSSDENENTKCRITLTHKLTGEKIHFYDSKPISFIPDIEKLKPKESGSNLGASFSELTREFGSAKAQKQLREKEKLNINKEAQKVLREAQRDALKDEKTEAAKGSKLEKSYMDCSLDGSFSGASLSTLIDSDQCIKFSSIAPQEVLDSLQSETQPLMSMSYEDIEKLPGRLSFHKCILDMIKKWDKYDIKKMTLCVLLEYMIRYLGLPIKKIRSKVPLDGCPESTSKFLLMNFSKEVLVDGGKSIIQVSREEKDKLLLLITVLFGYLNDYEFPIHNFMIDVKVGRDKLKKLGQLVNIKIVFLNREHYAKAAKPFVLENL